MAVARPGITPGTRYQPITGRPAFVWAFLDAMVLARRSVLATVRLPELIVFTAIQPVMFVLLFRYVFGGAIQVPGGQYVNFLMPGIFVQTVAFGGVITGIGLAEDMHRGLIDRWLQVFARHSPVSVLSDALRGLCHVNPALTTADTRWALIRSVVWIVALLAVFVPLAVFRYRHTTAR